MSTRLKRGACLALSVILPLCGAHATQEISASLGGMIPMKGEERSYTWQVDYRRDFSRHLGWSATWINEGHVTGHRRDGLAAQGWAHLPAGDGRFRVGLGFGVYTSFDTQLQSNGDWRNVHGWAPIGSLAVTYYLSSPWFWRLGVNHISPQAGFKVNTFNLGLGYRLGGPGSEAPHIPFAEQASNRNEFTFFVGRTVVNEKPGNLAIASGAEFRRVLIPWLDWTLSWLHEGSPDGINRKGLASQLWIVNRFFDERLAFGVGGGPYLYVDRGSTISGSTDRRDVAWLLSPTISYQFSKHWLGRFVFNRVSTDYHRDTDVLFFGLGRRW